MAVNDPKWHKGEVDTFQSSGTAPIPRWYQGEMLSVHEYVAPVGGLSIPIAMYHYMHH